MKQIPSKLLARLSPFVDCFSVSIVFLESRRNKGMRTLKRIFFCTKKKIRSNSVKMDLNDFDDDKSPPIFISYQWESQEIVMELKRRLETAGFCCWMDTSLMTGGDSLYGKIYEGISRSKIVIACLTPRYISSKFCIREIILADVLHKPILPVMIEATPWPPPGPIALIVSSLVFVDLFGMDC